MKRQKPMYTIVLSLDAVGSRDWEYLKHLPNIRQLLEHASYCKCVKSVYPSLTYPAHATIVTGRYPDHHGIVNNTKLQPGMVYPDWYWKRKSIKGVTLYEEAKKHGFTTAALLWPVTGGAKIKWNMPEIWSNRPWNHQAFASLLNGSPKFQLQMLKRFGYLLNGTNQPQLDHFVLQAALYTIKNYHPNLMLVHLTDVDTNRHRTGIDSVEIPAALERHDVRIGEIMRVLKEENMWEDTALIILGDHSHIGVDKVFQPNYFLEQSGLLKIRNGVIKRWRAMASTCDGSCYLYLRRGCDKKDRAQLLYALREMKEKYPQVIERIYSREEIRQMGADSSALYMLEAKAGYMFLDGADVPLYAIDTEQKRPHHMLSAHGFHPDKPGYQTIFMAAGAGIREGVVLPKMSLIEEGPTIARLLGFELPDADGRPLEEILVAGQGC